jgi:hypothetical protein
VRLVRAGQLHWVSFHFYEHIADEGAGELTPSLAIEMIHGSKGR